MTILFFLTVGTMAFGQILNYEVIRGNKKIGDMIVKRTALENRTFYEINSEVNFRILFSFTVNYHTSSEYKFGQLIKEQTHSKLNGNTQKKSTVWYDGSKYTLDQEGAKTHLDGPINYSVTSIYYQEPMTDRKVYSPHFGKYLYFEKLGDHHYKLESPDGLNEYWYTNGICTKVKVYRDFARFSFVMTPESLVAVKEKRIIAGNVAVD